MSAFMAGLGAALLQGSRFAGRFREEAEDQRRYEQNREMELAQRALTQSNADRAYNLNLDQFDLSKQTHQRNLASDILEQAGPTGVLDPTAASTVEAGGLGFRLGPQQDATLSSTQFAPDMSQVASPGLEAGRPVIPNTTQRFQLEEQNAAQAQRQRVERTIAAIEDPSSGFWSMPPDRRAAAAAVVGIKLPQSYEEWKTQQDYAQGLELEQIEARNRGLRGSNIPRGVSGMATRDEFNAVNRLRTTYMKETEASREMERQYGLMQDGLEAARKGHLNPGSQAVLVTFQKLLDPASVVRESEYSRSPEGQAYIDRIEGMMQRMTQGGPGVIQSNLAEFTALGEQFLMRARQHAEISKRNIEEQADYYQLPRDFITGAYTPGAGTGAPPGAAPTAPIADEEWVKDPTSGKWVRKVQ